MKPNKIIYFFFRRNREKSKYDILCISYLCSGKPRADQLLCNPPGWEHSKGITVVAVRMRCACLFFYNELEIRRSIEKRQLIFEKN